MEGRNMMEIYSTIEETVTEWWGLDGEMLDQELQGYLADMNELFIKPENGRRKLLPAWKLIRKYARVLDRKGQPLDLGVE